jgi:hypothetical protein
MPEEQMEGPAREIRTQVLCPGCHAFAWRVTHRFLDVKTGKTIRLYQCRCGGRIWDD